MSVFDPKKTFPVLASTDFSIDNFAAIDLFYDGTSVTTDSTNSYGNYQLVVNSLTPTGFDITLQTWFTVPGSDPNASVIANVGAISWPETATVGGNNRYQWNFVD